MIKRFLAWVLLAGFVLLLLNMAFFHVYQMQSFALYAIIAVWFVFSGKNTMSKKSKISDEVIQKMNKDVEKENVQE